MKTLKRVIAISEVLLIFPATLFMTALFLREVQPAAQTGRLVSWFAALPVQIGLYLLLVLLPLGALVIGGATLLRSWRRDTEFREAAQKIFIIGRAHAASLLIAGTTLTAAVILCLVTMHMITE